MKLRWLHKRTVSALLLVSLVGCSSEGQSVEPTATKKNEELRQFTVTSTGDILLHERTWTQAKKDADRGNWDFYPQLADISNVVKSADFSMCHLETPLAVLDSEYSGYPVFNSPPQIITAIKKLGFDFCEQVSNHSLDQGVAGITRTLNYFDAANIRHTGTYRTQAEANIPTVISVSTAQGPMHIGVIAASYGFNGFEYPEGQTWLVNKIDTQKIISDARKARAAGADIVIVHLHWGEEYLSSVSELQQSTATILADSDVIDLILGDHSHVVQPIDKIGKMWVAYGHGNLLAAQREPESRKSEGLLTRWTFTETSPGAFEISKVEFAPLLITDQFPVRVIDVHKALASNSEMNISKSRLELAAERTGLTVTALNSQPQLLSR